MKTRWYALSVLVGVVAVLFLAACSPNAEDSLVIYSGRKESLIGSLVTDFEKETGIDVQVKYGGTATLAALIMQEGDKSPADIFFAEDGGALGALSKSGHFAKIQNIDRVAKAYRSPKDEWIGISGRARTVVYNKEQVSESDMPATMQGFCDEKWKGKIGWAPANGSFQSFVTYLRVTQGEEAAEKWLACIAANEPKAYAKNSHIVQAAGKGDVAVGFVNHYYLHRFLKSEGPDFGAANHYMKGNAALVNVAGVGVLKQSDMKDAAQQFVDFLLRKESQEYFATQTFEYPLAAGVAPSADIPAVSAITPKNVDLSKLDDLEGTLALLKKLELL